MIDINFCEAISETSPKLLRRVPKVSGEDASKLNGVLEAIFVGLEAKSGVGEVLKLKVGRCLLTSHLLLQSLLQVRGGHFVLGPLWTLAALDGPFTALGLGLVGLGQLHPWEQTCQTGCQRPLRATTNSRLCNT